MPPIEVKIMVKPGTELKDIALNGDNGLFPISIILECFISPLMVAVYSTDLRKEYPMHLRISKICPGGGGNLANQRIEIYVMKVAVTVF
jgi:hypothetical protein